MAVITPNTPITFRVQDPNPGLRFVVIWMLYNTEVETFLVYDGTDFVGLFNGPSTATPDAQGTNFSILPVGGWVEDIAQLRIRALDEEGAIDVE